jgi:hypothetical protein
MTKASESQLNALHGALAEALTPIIRDGVVVGGEGDNVVKITAPASYFAAAIALLKNNNITADPEQNEALRTLRDRLAKERQDRKGRLGSNQEAAALLEKQLGGVIDAS